MSQGKHDGLSKAKAADSMELQSPIGNSYIGWGKGEKGYKAKNRRYTTMSHFQMNNRSVTPQVSSKPVINTCS